MTRETWTAALLPLVAATVALLVHVPGAGGFFYTHDCWSDLGLGERVLAGELPWTENVQRLLPTWSFGPRAAFGVLPWVWHLPNLLVHALNAALVVLLGTRLGFERGVALAGGALFGGTALLAHAVEWVGGGYDVFCTFGLLASALAMSHGRVALACAAGLVALLSKETGVVLPVVLVAVGWATTRPTLRSLAIPGALSVALVALILLLRLWQARSGAGDTLAGRSVSLDPALLAASLPIGLGVAAAAAVVGSDSSAASALWVVVVGLLALALAWGLAGPRRRSVAGLIATAVATLVPLGLAGLTGRELVENTRYLYAATAFLGPLVPFLLSRVVALCVSRAPVCEGEARVSLHRLVTSALVLALVLVTAGTGVARVLQARTLTTAVAAVADAVLSEPTDRRVVVFTSVFDEPTARFLMSRWLRDAHGISARYIMRGSGVAFTRRSGQGEAALAYFGPSPAPFEPGTVGARDRVLVQDVRSATVTRAPPPPSPTRALQWTTVPLEVAFLPSTESEDARLEGVTVTVDRAVGPASQASIEPVVALTLPEGPPLRGVALTVHVEALSEARYAAGYHDRWAAIWVGPGSDAPMATLELPPQGQSKTLYLDLTRDPVWPSDGVTATRVGLLPSSYPARVTLLGVQVAR